MIGPIVYVRGVTRAWRAHERDALRQWKTRCNIDLAFMVAAQDRTPTRPEGAVRPCDAGTCRVKP